MIGLLPNERDRGLQAFREALVKRTGLDIQTYVPADYAELVKAFKDGKVDFAFFSPLTFIQVEREANAKALLKKVYGKTEFYYSAVVVRADSPFKKLEDLKGKRFGFVDPKSTSGFLYPRVLCRKAGFDPFVDGPREFFGTHQASVQALLEKKVDAIGVWADEPAFPQTGAWSDGEFSKLNPRDFRVLATSEPIPNDAFAVRSEFYEKQPLVVFKVMEAMIGVADDPSRLFKQVFNVERMATATSRHYDSVRALEGLLQEKKP